MHRRKLIVQLQKACAGELAAIHAYRGHARSLRDAQQRERIRVIEGEEAHHRALVIELLRSLDARPNRVREVVFFVIGKTIALLCRIGGWFLPMYGAGRLESGNIVEYEDAAEYARLCGHDEMIECLLGMAETERQHERFFRELIAGHPLLRVFPTWKH